MGKCHDINSFFCGGGASPLIKTYVACDLTHIQSVLDSPVFLVCLFCQVSSGFFEAAELKAHWPLAALNAAVVAVVAAAAAGVVDAVASAAAP